MKYIKIVHPLEQTARNIFLGEIKTFAEFWKKKKGKKDKAMPLTLCHFERSGGLGDADQSVAGGIRALREVPRVVRWICVNKASVALLVACFTIVTIAVQTRDHVICAALPPMGQALQFYV